MRRLPSGAQSSSSFRLIHPNQIPSGDILNYPPLQNLAGTLRSPSRAKTEILSGLTVALALVPEAVAFSFVAGVHPLVGLHAAFMVGLITSLFGGRPGMISGATGALAVVMVALVAQHGVEYLFAAVILMGVLQILAGVFRLGKFIRMVPHPVMLGFVNGLAIVIFLAQLSQFKVPGPDGTQVWMQGGQLILMLSLIVITMCIIQFFPKLTNAVPAPLAAIVLVSVAVIVLNLDIPRVGDLASIAGGFPEFHIPMVPLTLETLWIVAPYAVILAAIGLIESLLTLNLVNDITETRGGASQECLALGAANTATGFFGGMGGCAMIGQSMINVNSGGRERLSGFSASIFLLIFILFTSSLIEQIPLPALVGVMFMVVIGTFAWNSFKIMRRVPKVDAFVIVLVTVTTVLTDLAIAVVVGVIASSLAYAWQNATRIQVVEEATTAKNTKVYKVIGPLFFGSVEGFQEVFSPKDDPENVVIDFMYSRVVDQSALQAIEALAGRYQQQGTELSLRHLSRDCHRLLTKAGQLVVDADDDPEYGLAVDYGVMTGRFGEGH
jgi:SulP family sulfate permease